jgi:hypothetical protein
MTCRLALVCFGAAVLLVAGASLALAAPLITVEIASAGPYDSYTIEQEGADLGDGTFGLAGVGYGTNFTCDWSIVVNPDPQITSTFSMTNLSAVTQTFVMNITIGIPAIGPSTVQGGYYGDALTGTTYTDTSGDGNVTLASVGANAFYTALVNGIASQGLGTFSVSSATSGTIAQETWGTPIPSAPFGPASGNMRIRWQFSLTGGDTVSTKGFFQVEPPNVPEPAGAALLGLGLAALAGARRRA